MQNLFDGATIWGGQNRELGPFPTTRTQRSVLPGIAGFRSYRLGTNSWVWTVTGLITRSLRVDLENDLNVGASYVDGGLYNFRTGAGTIYSNCLLNDFRPVGRIERCQLMYLGGWVSGYCVNVTGTVEWAGPTY